MRSVMIFGIGTPSACERSRTLTPDSTETGPVGGAGGWGPRPAPRAAVPRRPLLARRPRSALVDDDAPTPPPGSAATTWAERAVRSVASVSHGSSSLKASQRPAPLRLFACRGLLGLD